MSKLARHRKYAERPGAYLLASRVLSNVFDPGDTIEFEQYITGYGEISSAKVLCYMSGDLFDLPKSYVLHSMGKSDEGMFFGNLKYFFETTAFTTQLNGPIQEGWGEPTMFFDPVESASISTELKIREAPFKYSLLLLKKIKPGEYTLDFFFTYYNGEKWVCSKEQVKLKVRNFFERHAGGLTTFGVIAGSIGIAASIFKVFAR